MTTLSQRWQTVVPLADGWRWVHNVGANIGPTPSCTRWNLESGPFIVLALQRRTNVGQTCLYLVGWTMLGQGHFLLVKRVCVVGWTQSGWRWANIKVCQIKSFLFWFTSIEPTCKITRIFPCSFIKEMQWYTAVQLINDYFDKSMNVILFIVECL